MMKTEIILLDHVDERDLTLAVHFQLTGPVLERSITEVGLLNLPVMQETAGKGYRTVRGFRRINALMKAGIADFEGVVVDENASILSLLAEGIHDNLQNLNLIDRALIVSKLSRLLPAEEVIEGFFKLLALHPTRKTFERLLALDGLEPAIKESVIRGVLHENSAYKLSGFSRISRLSLHKILGELKLSVSKQQEMIGQIKELAERRKVSIEKITGIGEIPQILRNDRLDQPQKADSLRKWLKGQLLPTLWAYENSFKEKRSFLALDREVHLTAPPFFEGDRFRVDFSFKSLEQFQERVKILKNAAQARELENILNLYLERP